MICDAVVCDRCRSLIRCEACHVYGDTAQAVTIVSVDKGTEAKHICLACYAEGYRILDRNGTIGYWEGYRKSERKN